MVRYWIVFIIVIYAFVNSAAAEPLHINELVLSPGENYLTAAVIDPQGGYVYFATARDNFRYSMEQATATVLRVSLVNFKNPEHITLQAGDVPLNAAMIDSVHSFAYFGTYGDPNRAVPATVVKIDLHRFLPVKSVTLGKEEFGISSAAMDPQGKIGYFGTLFGSVVSVRLNDMAEIGNLELQQEDNAFQAVVVDPAGIFAYFATDTGNIMKVRLADFSPVGNLTALRAEKGFSVALMDPNGHEAYFATQGSPAKIVRINLDAFKVDKVLTLAEGENAIGTALLGPLADEAIFVTAGKTPQIIRVNLSTFKRMAELVLPDSIGSVTCGVMDGSHRTLYLGTTATPARIVKFTFEP